MRFLPARSLIATAAFAGRRRKSRQCTSSLDWCPIAPRPSIRESVLAALQLSAQKWGAISVHGDRDFMRACVELAAEHGFKIANPELQEVIAAKRRRHRTHDRPEACAPPCRGCRIPRRTAQGSEATLRD